MYYTIVKYEVPHLHGQSPNKVTVLCARDVGMKSVLRHGHLSLPL